jgi:uncharacterized membrane protein YfcA
MARVMLTSDLDPASLGLLFLAAVVAGGVNAIAGGGTILTFAVLSAILPPGPGRLVSANVTSKIGLWPGAAAAAWASRRSWAGLPEWARWLVLPSGLGAVAGVALLRYLPKESFDAVVPWLILLAALLFALQPQLSAASRPREAAREKAPGQPAGLSLTIFGLQLLVGTYGGYFGAGIGILMLAALSLLRLGDMHALNAVKNLLAATVNGVATLVLVVAALAGGFDVSWLHVAVLAAGSVAGGMAVAALAQRLPAKAVRRLVAIIAFTLAGYHFWREWAG